MELQNRGVISIRPAKTLSLRARSRTLIVSGVARSGTSMVARVLSGAGVFMGDEMDDVVFEDHAFVRLFGNGLVDPAQLHSLLRERNRRHAVWGFKRPHLHTQGAESITRFRNPVVILTVRDPVAIAERNAIAEQREPLDSLVAAMDDQLAMLRFAQELSCPVLLISYEKAVSHPDSFIKRLLEFCGLAVLEEDRRKLVALVQPDRPEYIEAARRHFDGYIDGIEGTVLVGWACQRGLTLPLTLTVFRDDAPAIEVIAGNHRDDLQNSGIGSGDHGFAVDLARLGFDGDSRVTVRVSGTLFVLNNSGQTIEALGGDLAAVLAGSLEPWADALGFV